MYMCGERDMAGWRWNWRVTLKGWGFMGFLKYWNALSSLMKFWCLLWKSSFLFVFFFPFATQRSKPSKLKALMVLTEAMVFSFCSATLVNFFSYSSLESFHWSSGIMGMAVRLVGWWARTDTVRGKAYGAYMAIVHWHMHIYNVV